MKGRKPNLQNVVPMKGDIQKEIPPAPDFLCDIGRDVWDELAPELAKRGRIELLYKYQFGSYCAAVANFISATNTLAMEGLFYEPGKGRNGNQRRRHPALTLQENSTSIMRRDSALFGLSPVDASRLDTGAQGNFLNSVLDQLNGSD
jgi:P27 family predicted phage terminase small subunit